MVAFQDASFEQEGPETHFKHCSEQLGPARGGPGPARGGPGQAGGSVRVAGNFKSTHQAGGCIGLPVPPGRAAVPMTTPTSR